jgi:hypothetical protein
VPRKSDHRLHRAATARDSPLADELQVVLGAGELDPGQLEVLLLDVQLVRRGDSLAPQLLGALPGGLGAVEGRLGGIEPPLSLDQLGRGRVGNDLEERIAGRDAVPDLDRTALDDTRDLRLDLELDPRLDLTDGHGLSRAMTTSAAKILRMRAMSVLPLRAVPEG